MNTPLISIIIPLYNAEKTILNTLESVRKQTYKGAFEILIINDGSTDNSQHLVEKYQTENPQLNIQLFHQKNKGVSAARNKGLKNAHGDYIALLDADDEWLPHKTQLQIDLLNKNPRIDFLASGGVNKKLLFPYTVKDHQLAKVTFRKLLFRNEILAPSVIFKKKIVDNTGFFNEEQKYAEDVNYWLKVSERYTMFILNTPLLICGGGKRTFGVSGLSANLQKMHLGFLNNLKEMHQHKRINRIEYSVYYLFYKIKYLVLLIRS